MRCEYCATPLTATAARRPSQVPQAPPAADEPERDPDRPRLWLGNHRWVVLGRIAAGATTDVHMVRRDARISELAVLALVRPGADARPLAREWEALEALRRSTTDGAAQFSRRLPEPIAHGTARLGRFGRSGERAATLVRWKSGFVHSFDDLRAVHPGGVPAEASVWLWKRILELLGWVHRAGWTHGAIAPARLLVHVRDHGVTLVGWSHAAPATPATTAADVAAGARCVRHALGDRLVPPPLARLLDAAGTGAEGTDAWATRDRLDAAAREVFGPPRYVALPMPGWS